MVTAIGQHLNTLKDGMDSNWKFILTLGAFLTLLTLNQQRSQQNSPLSRLIYTINSLKDLVILHRKFKIKLKLAEFMDPIKSNVVSWILDWTTSPHEIGPLLSSFLLNYIHRWDLEQDATLAEYVYYGI